MRVSGQVAFFSIPNIWSGVFHLQEQGITCNFFTWFSDHSLSGSDKIVLIKGKMWPNYYNTTCYVKGNQTTIRRVAQGHTQGYFGTSLVNSYFWKLSLLQGYFYYLPLIVTPVLDQQWCLCAGVSGSWLFWTASALNFNNVASMAMAITLLNPRKWC